MADDQHQHQQQSRFPPVSPENHHHQSRAPVAPRAPMAATVLPSIHETRAAAGYASQPPPPSARPYPLDGRYSSPNAVNGYPPPPASQQSSSSTFLPPLQASPTDARSPAYPPPDQRTPYLDDRRPPGPYGAEGFYFRGPPPGPVPPNSYPRPPQGAYQEYAQQAAGAPSLAQAAPRQRTSIACRYCRKRKIRCSGYQNTPGGKCQNCARMNQECIFQPVSSSSSTAFIPVSAVPGGVPPGTQLFGAYGQPLAPNVMAGAHPYPPQQHPGGPSPGMYPPPPQQQQQQQAESRAMLVNGHVEPSRFRRAGKGINDALISRLRIRSHPHRQADNHNHNNNPHLLTMLPHPTELHRSSTVTLSPYQNRVFVVLKLPEHLYHRQYSLWVLIDKQPLKPCLHPLPDQLPLERAFEVVLHPGINVIEAHLIAAVPRCERQPGEPEVELEVFTALVNLLRP